MADGTDEDGARATATYGHGRMDCVGGEGEDGAGGARD